MAKRDERPIRPETATELALMRHITGRTQQAREERYARLLSADVGDVKRATVEAFERDRGNSAVCVVANRARLEEANAELGEGALKVQSILG